MKLRFLGLLATFIPLFCFSQWNYPTHESLKNQIQALSSSKSVEIASIGKTYASEEIPLIKIQQSKSPKPTLLIVAGVDARHPAGTINALQLAKNLLALPSDQLDKILSSKSIWIIPVLNVDGYRRNQKDIILGSGNARIIDNDRDGRIDEDINVDLNKDAVISQMRVKTPAGTFKNHSQNPNFLIKADKSKGESGTYEIFKEGIDADLDGLFAEDDKSGVNLDRNFTFDYPFLGFESGDYAASELETQAMMDFIFNNPQIATILHFGLQNNLSVPENFDQGKSAERITKSWSNNDVQVSTFVSQMYNDIMKPLGEAPKMSANKGNFSNTAYYHAGKFSFVTPSWWVPTLTDTSKNASKVPLTKEDDKFVFWVSQKNIQGAILPWTKVEHPNFPNQEVEVGGLVEKFKNNPPVEILNESAKLHTDFVVKLIESMATLEFSKPKVTALGDEVFRVEIVIYNSGALPTYPEIADKIKHVSKVKSILDLQKGQQFLSGKRLDLYPSLNAGASRTLSWLIKGKGKATLTVGCPSAGDTTLEINL